MISREKLQQAVEHNLLQAQQLEPLYEFLTQDKHEVSPTVEAREEPLKFIRSFGDIFITLGIVLLVLASHQINISGYYYLIPAAGFVVLAEWLVRVRKLALPGIAILIAILYFVNKAIAFNHHEATTFGLAVLSVTSLLFYLRYRMPFSLLPLVAGILAIIVLQLGMDLLEKPWVFILLGLIVFTIAMGFDIQDTGRKSHLSDSAFWLHLLAAPLLVHGSMVTLLINDPVWLQSINKEIIMILFFVVFFLVALLLDRRALLISTQIYVIYALTQLLQNHMSGSQNILMYILMGLGLFVIFFGTYWYKTRSLIFGFLRPYSISRYIPDLSADHTLKAG
jgi:hypothetical protein